MYVVVQIFQTFFYLLYCYCENVIRFFVPERRKSFAGKLVLVTGAGRGIGREIALRFSDKGARMVLLDINKANVEKVVKEIQENGHTAMSYVCDVSKIDSIKATCERIRKEAGQVEILVNNAGILHGGALLDITEADIQKTFDINIMAYIWFIREFLPGMIKKNEGHIVNIASMSAIRGVAYLAEYSSSKHAVKGLAQGLQDEMRREGHTGIKFTTVYPMFVNTGLVTEMIDKSGNWLTPAQVAEATVEGTQMNKVSVFVPSGMASFVRFGQAFLPAKFVDEPTDLMYKGIAPQYKKRRD